MSVQWAWRLAWVFCANTDKRGTNDCWEWLAGKNIKGYGIFNTGWRYIGTDKAHRIAWIITNGELLKSDVICHKCDNPGCCNPKHLFKGTQADNIRDKVSKNRQARLERHGRSVLTNTQVLAIRASKLSCTELVY